MRNTSLAAHVPCLFSVACMPCRIAASLHPELPTSHRCGASIISFQCWHRVTLQGRVGGLLPVLISILLTMVASGVLSRDPLMYYVAFIRHLHARLPTSHTTRGVRRKLPVEDERKGTWRDNGPHPIRLFIYRSPSSGPCHSPEAIQRFRFVPQHMDSRLEQSWRLPVSVRVLARIISTTGHRESLTLPF